MEMLVFNSRIRRSRMAREVTCLPSLPASGPSLMENCIDTVGGSMATKGSGSMFAAGGEGFADVDVFNAGGDADDAARAATFGVGGGEAGVGEGFHHLRLLLWCRPCGAARWCRPF